MKHDITIVTQSNCPGTLADIAAALAEHDININDIEANDEHGQGIIVIRVCDTQCDHALRILNQAGFQALSHAVLLLDLEDKPGSLARLAMRFKEESINIRSMHIIRREDGRVIVALSASEMERARELLQDCLVNTDSNPDQS